jgi:hypothetical protein
VKNPWTPQGRVEAGSNPRLPFTTAPFYSLKRETREIKSDFRPLETCCVKESGESLNAVNNT